MNIGSGLICAILLLSNSSIKEIKVDNINVGTEDFTVEPKLQLKLVRCDTT